MSQSHQESSRFANAQSAVIAAWLGIFVVALMIVVMPPERIGESTQQPR